MLRFWQELRTQTPLQNQQLACYNQALKRRGSLTVWFDADMEWEAKPSGKRGRQQVYSNAAIQTCLTLKVLFGLPLRQATGFVESLLALSGLSWSVPDFSTLSRRQDTLRVAIPYRPTEGLHLLIDSTGIKVEGEGERLRSPPVPSGMHRSCLICSTRSTLRRRSPA